MPDHLTDAVVVGSGPNGLAAAITLAKAGRSVVVLEANDTIGGAARSAELTEPGFIHDLGSAIHPMVKASPFFRSIEAELVAHGLQWTLPPAAAAHPLDGGRAGVVWNDLDRTATNLGPDADAYRKYYSRWVDDIDDVIDLALRPLIRVPSRPLFSASFGAASALPAATTARRKWNTDRAQAIFAGHAAHAILPLTNPFTSSFGLLLGSLAHGHGWGFPTGGAQSLVDAMVSLLRSLGGEIVTGTRVESVADLPPSRATIFTLTPRQVEAIMGDALPDRYRESLRGFRLGPGACKVDFTLDEPIPWAHDDVASASTVHLGGKLEEIIDAEQSIADGEHGERPFVLLAQHTMFDPTRAPAGKHTAWAYCHVPNGSTVDQTVAIIGQIERFAPGFRDIVRTKHTTMTPALEAMNANLIGGDIGGGSYSGRQLFARPRLQMSPFTTPIDNVFIGSASTTPGAGVHGMSGYAAAQQAIGQVLN